MGRWRASLILSNMARIITIPKSTNPNISPHPLNPLRLFLSSNSTNRFFSALPSPSPIYDNDFYYRLPNFDVLDSKQDLDTPKIPIKAYFLCTSIDLKSMHAENSSNVVPPTSRSSNYIALRFCNFPSKTTGIRIEENVSCCHYMVVFQYGSAVLFNVEDHEIEFYLEIVRRHASGLLPEMRKDDYAVKEKPTLIEDMQGGPDYIVLKNLDTDSIRIIGSVLGQSIALDYFVSQVDGMVEEFTDINRGMEKTGTFTMKRKKLFQLVGKANSNLADVILKVGLFDRSEIAWRDAKYGQIFEYLRDEYEVTQRFGNLDFKLKFVEHNIHFLQEVLQNRRSDLLEWCIIFLLSIENIISVYEIVRESTVVPM
ncbi:Sporulation protein RMD1 [Camellia lanceoleosa]|uniref:Sporulation protein RMD1 n=1 Tax=Camellia lanceoleosa TaxID=1840588 RepID=A0ACC0G3K6_9ERIC|nr:Sporulation protein RMD1 [Camellia lanceoleosa]